MKNKQKDEELKVILNQETGCVVQHDGWPCSTCFFAIDDSFTNQDWQTVLWIRGDYDSDELDNLPESINESRAKILEACEVEMTSENPF